MSDCSCVLVDIDGYAELIDEKIVTARKTHKCGECCREIAKGEKYEKVTQIWEGKIETQKTCLDCVSIRNAFFCNGWLWGNILEDLWDHLVDMRGEIASSCIIGLTKGARDKICDMIQEVWECIYEDEEEEDEE